MRAKDLVYMCLPIVCCQACSSTPSVKGFQADETLSTLNDRSQPSWADESVPFGVRDGKAFSVGVATLRGSDRPEAGFRIAENNARANFAKTIENRMEFIFQSAEENAGIDSNQAHYIGSEVSRLTSHAMKVEGQYWKRFAQSDEDGTRRIYYKVYSLVTMPEDRLKKAVDDAIAGRVPEKKLSQGFQAKVDQQWDRFVEGKTSEKVADRSPTSSSNAGESQ
jgi:hypothetical protein